MNLRKVNRRSSLLELKRRARTVNMNTRDQIIEAAVKLFSQKGVDDISLRDVSRIAGVNVATVSYHFGGKSGLIDEVVALTFIDLNRQRIRLLKEAGDKAGGFNFLEIQDVLGALLRPVVFPSDYGISREIVLRLTSRYLMNVDYVLSEIVQKSFGDVYKIFALAINSIYSHVTYEKAVEMLLFSTASALMYENFSRVAARSMEGGGGDEIYFEDVVRFCSAGFLCCNDHLKAFEKVG